ncbi:hypothetical protein DU508_14180 [Pedobacter chinensis]|uniref:Outer membrane protein beta-barrel domain-containing protein n=1 Tax=Pedobacter chinensis TaxID=2282421 RepID=A0A369PZ12_9SPHI|nr:hypothetical protein [Pedobacter chinensis]RDC55996.1 hypothetical protein DU508_14180 [Pedobacter chinensis]
MREEKDIDKLFKDGLENPDIPYNDLDWDVLEERLHPNQKRRIIPFFWMTAVAGIAAVLLVVFLLIEPHQNLTDVNVDNKKYSKDKENPISDLHTKPAEKDRDRSKISNTLTIGNNPNAFAALNQKFVDKKTLSPKADTFIFNQHGRLADLSNNRIEPEFFQSSVTLAHQEFNTPVALKSADKPSIKSTKRKPNFVLGIVAAPDLTSVQKSGKSSLSGGIGIEATLMLTKRLSITTGASYAKKIYDSDFSLYRPQSNYVFKNQPTNIHANCDVLDIPLNVNYKLLGNNRNSLTLSTGLSSYLMLKEAYYYSYQNDYAAGPQSYEVKNQNQHFLGVANIGVAFQHQISNKLSISITPFAKVPLTNIGYGNSKLSSTGIAVSVNMTNLFNKKQGPSIP